MPDWLRTRRSEVIARLAVTSHHRIEADGNDVILGDGSVTRDPGSGGPDTPLSGRP